MRRHCPAVPVWRHHSVCAFAHSVNRLVPPGNVLTEAMVRYLQTERRSLATRRPVTLGMCRPAAARSSPRRCFQRRCRSSVPQHGPQQAVFVATSATKWALHIVAASRVNLDAFQCHQQSRWQAHSPRLTTVCTAPRESGRNGIVSEEQSGSLSGRSCC